MNVSLGQAIANLIDEKLHQDAENSRFATDFPDSEKQARDDQRVAELIQLIDQEVGQVLAAR
ncbi:hypothetical protein C8J36_1133 [Rhizobium sp. PP-F2F-G48]|nr:hypothetical protein C8J36_1133 [Rhizobium sp. PP-F2F-G48]